MMHVPMDSLAPLPVGSGVCTAPRDIHPSMHSECLLPTHKPQNLAGQSECGWSPYVNNGGTVLAVAGDDYAVVVADTRLSLGYSIHTRNCTKMTKLTEKCMIATAGMQAEMATLHRILKVRIALYAHNHRKPPNLDAIAHMLSSILYNKRFFPFYTFNILAGVDDKGVGAVYGYDAVGSLERLKYSSSGTGSSLMMSILDNQIKKNNQLKPSPALSKTDVIDLMKDVITSAGERDIYTGDAAEVCVIDASGMETTKMDLRLD